MKDLKSLIAWLAILFLAGCSSMLPPEARDHVRKNSPEVQPEYSKTGPPSPALTPRLGDVLRVGSDVDLLYQVCGEPDEINRRGTRLLYDSCEGRGRFEVSIRNERIARIWY